MIPFISLADLGLFVEQDLSQSQLGVIAIDSACEVVRTELNQTVNLVTDDVVRLDGTGRQSLLLPELPVRSVSSVLIAPDTDDEAELEEDDYVIGEAGVLWRSSRHGWWTMGHQNIEVTYTHGWDMTEEVQTPEIVHVPSDIRLVALQVAAEILVAGTVGVGGITTEGIGNYNYSIGQLGLGAKLLTEVRRQILGRYRIDP